MRRWLGWSKWLALAISIGKTNTKQGVGVQGRTYHRPCKMNGFYGLDIAKKEREKCDCHHDHAEHPKEPQFIKLFFYPFHFEHLPNILL